MGTINFALRHEDGTIWAAQVWETVLSRFTRKYLTTEDKAPIVDDYVRRHRQEAGAFCYPDFSGLYVIDDKSKTLLGTQGCSNMTAISDFNRFIRCRDDGCEVEDYKFYKNLHEAGWLALRRQTFRRESTRSTVEMIIQPSSAWPDFDTFFETAYAGFHRDAITEEKGCVRRSSIVLVPGDWTIEEFVVNQRGTRAFKAHLAGLGFSFAPDEEAGWLRCLRDRMDYGDDGEAPEFEPG